MTSRRWCFTSYAEDICPWAYGTEPDTLVSGVRYAVFQRELCPATARLHWQGYIELRSPMRMPAVQRLIGDLGAHLDKPNGTRDQCRDYCTKESSRVGDPTEFGNFQSGGAGRRTDIDGALAVIRLGGPSTIRTLYDDHGSVMVRYTRGLTAAYNHYCSRADREAPPSVFVHYGLTGTGKTRAIYDSTSLPDLFRAPVSTSNVQWFDGYIGQPVALFDDFDGEHPHITIMLQVLDRYPLMLPVKGGFIHWVPTTIYITTNVPFDHWYPQASEPHLAALKRRITKFIHFS